MPFKSRREDPDELVQVMATKEGHDGQGVRQPGEKFMVKRSALPASWFELVKKDGPERTATAGAMGRPQLDDLPTTPAPATEDEWADLGRPQI